MRRGVFTIYATDFPHGFGVYSFHGLIHYLVNWMDT